MRAYIDVCAGYPQAKLKQWAKEYKVKLKQVEYSPNGDLVYCVYAKHKSLILALANHYDCLPNADFITEQLCYN